MANNAADFTIGANDEHGQDEKNAACRTPVMPYINRGILFNEFNRAVKLRFLQALLRIGFEAFDVKPESEDVPEKSRLARINARRIDRLATFGYNMFGSGNVFTHAHGFVTSYCPKCRFPHDARAFCEDAAFALEEAGFTGSSIPESENTLLLSECVSIRVLAGYGSDYKEAALMLDPDFAIQTAECVARAVCVNLDVPFICRENTGSYKTLRVGDMGKGVRLLQYLLAFEGYPLAPDGIFGRKTAESLNAFKRDNLLEQNAVADEAVYRKLLNLGSNSFSRAEILYLQRKLSSKLYDVNTDGVMDEKTARALARFQKDNALNETGVADKATLDALKTAPPRPRLY